MKTIKPKKTKTASGKAPIKAQQKKAKAALEGSKLAIEAKADALNKKIKKATAEAKAQLEQRITELKADHKKRQAIVQKARAEMADV